MSLVWGYDGAGWTSTDEGTQTTSGIAFGINASNGASITAIASGSVTSAKLYVSNWQTSTAFKVVVYSADGLTRLGISDAVPSSAGTGLLTATFSTPFSVVNGTDYNVYVVPTGYLDVRTNNAGPAFSVSVSAITYATPESTLPTPADQSYKIYIIWLDATAAGGSANKGRKAALGVGG